MLLHGKPDMPIAFVGAAEKPSNPTPGKTK